MIPACWFYDIQNKAQTMVSGMYNAPIGPSFLADTGANLNLASQGV